MNCATFHTSWFCQFLTRLDASLPLLKSVFMWVFTHSASHRAALLFSHDFQPGVPTSYSTVLHCPGAHSSNCVKFVQRVFACTQVCMCVPLWSCKRLFCICSPYLCVHASLCTTHQTWIASKRWFKRLQRLILNYYFDTCSLTGGDIIISFCTFISFDIDCNSRADVRAW